MSLKKRQKPFKHNRRRRGPLLSTQSIPLPLQMDDLKPRAFALLGSCKYNGALYLIDICDSFTLEDIFDAVKNGWSFVDQKTWDIRFKTPHENLYVTLRQCFISNSMSNGLITQNESLSTNYDVIMNLKKYLKIRIVMLVW